MDKGLDLRLREKPFRAFDQQQLVAPDCQPARASIERDSAATQLTPDTGKSHPTELANICLLFDADAGRVADTKLDNRFGQFLKQIIRSLRQLLRQRFQRPALRLIIRGAAGSFP
nr:hypothetical protein [Parapontixanthobacter aurantiacus]